MTNPFLSRLPSSAHSNLLVYCAVAELHETARELEEWCGPVVHACALPGPLDLPRPHAGSVLLTRVEELSPDQQVAVFDWMTQMHLTTRVVSIATARLDRLVRQGLFLEDLFYRLNVLQIELDAQPVGGSIDDRVLDDARCRV